MATFPAAEYEKRRERLFEHMEAERLDALFVPPSSDLEYLTGVSRDLPSFGEISYAHGWATGAFLVPGREPVFVLPRMFALFHLGGSPPPGAIVIAETDDAEARFRDAARRVGSVRRLGVGQRTWAETVVGLQRALAPGETVNASPLVNALRRVKSSAELELMTEAVRFAERVMAELTPLVLPGATMAELAGEVDDRLRAAGSRCPSFPTHVFSVGERTLDSGDASALDPLREGELVLFDFGAVHQGYCSDFGRTVCCGAPSAAVVDAYEALLAAQEAGRNAARPGITAHELNSACRQPIEDAGLGEHFRHRMGHGIGLDVHERPFLSDEDDTQLEAGMTFTDEPSIVVPGRLGVRIEDVIAVEDGGGRTLGSYPRELVSGGAADASRAPSDAPRRRP